MEVKVCIIGDTDVGKTSLSMRYCHGDFPESSSPTIGASFLQRRVLIDNTEISLQIWDTAGQERFRSMAPMYYRGAKAAICVFDVTNEESFNRVSSWLRDLRNHADPNVVICIAGNKCDKPPSFNLDAAEELASSLNATFIRTSAVTGEGVDAVFNTLTRRISDTYSKSKVVPKDADVLKIKEANKQMEKQKGGCC